jgi:hypothetical protein
LPSLTKQQAIWPPFLLSSPLILCDTSQPSPNWLTTNRANVPSIILIAAKGVVNECVSACECAWGCGLNKDADDRLSTCVDGHKLRECRCVTTSIKTSAAVQ